MPGRESALGFRSTRMYGSRITGCWPFNPQAIDSIIGETWTTSPLTTEKFSLVTCCRNKTTGNRDSLWLFFGSNVFGSVPEYWLLRAIGQSLGLAAYPS